MSSFRPLRVVVSLLETLHCPMPHPWQQDQERWDEELDLTDEDIGPEKMTAPRLIPVAGRTQ
jgi:hypothetical protein